MSEVYKFCKTGTKTAKLTGLRTNESVTSTSGDTMEVLLNQLFPGDELRKGIIEAQKEEFCGNEINRENVLSSLTKMRLKKSPGINGTTLEMVLNMWEILDLYIFDLFNDYLVRGEFLKSWKMQKVVILLKGGDKDRPIPCYLFTRRLRQSD